MKMDMKLLPMKIVLLAMGTGIVISNVTGYDTLFSLEKGIFGIISLFGLIMITAEVAVLLYTSSILSSYFRQPKILQYSLPIVVILFSFLSFSGLNSYLTNSALKDYKLIETTKNKELASNDRVNILNKESDEYAVNIEALNKKQEEITTMMGKLDAEIIKISGLIDKRRLKTRGQCQDSPDCTAVVSGFNDKIKGHELSKNTYQKQINNILSDIKNNQDLISKKKQEISSLEKDKFERQDLQSGSESEHTSKIGNYEKVVGSVLGIFNIKVDKPFEWFIGLVAAIIYPVYFLVNMYIGLNSEENKEYFATKRSTRKDKTITKMKLYAMFVRWYKSNRAVSKRRVKFKEKIVEVEKIIEVPTGHIVEKSIEVPVYVTKIEKVIEQVPIERQTPYPMFVPVPEGISPKKLKELEDEIRLS